MMSSFSTQVYIFQRLRDTTHWTVDFSIYGLLRVAGIYKVFVEEYGLPSRSVMPGCA